MVWFRPRGLFVSGENRSIVFVCLLPVSLSLVNCAIAASVLSLEIGGLVCFLGDSYGLFRKLPPTKFDGVPPEFLGGTYIVLGALGVLELDLDLEVELELELELELVVSVSVVGLVNI